MLNSWILLYNIKKLLIDQEQISILNKYTYNDIK